MRRFSVFLFTLLLCTSCEQSETKRTFYNDSGLLVRRTYQKDSVTVVLERTFKNDSIPHGYGKSFYPSGQVELYIEYFEGKKHGKEIEYYQNGNKRKEGWNNNGMIDSTWIWYDSLQNIKQVESWDKGTLVGEQRSYYPNGKIRLCAFYDPTGRVIYRANFDERGDLKMEQGQRKPIIVVRTHHAVEHWKIGETFVADIYVCPCTSNLLSTVLHLYHVDEKKIIESVPLRNTNFSFLFSLEKEGKYELVATMDSLQTTFTFSAEY